MPHELDRNEATGQKAVFSVGETPWHREGKVLTAAPTMEEALVLSGADFDVEMREVHVESGSAMMRSPIGRAVIRTDRGTTLISPSDVLALVSEKYSPLQNRDVFAVLEPLMDRGVARLETGGTLRGGRDVWMMVQFTIDDPVVREVFADEVVPFGLVTNNHSGEARAMVMQTPIRVVCANTLGAATTGWKERADVIAVSHRGDARVRVVEAAEKMFGGIIERYKVIAENYRTLKETRLAVDDFVKSVLDVAAPLPKDLHAVEGEHLTVRGYDLARAAAEKRRTAITDKWTNGKGHVGDHSAWEAYNGAVEVIDHDAVLFRTNGSRVASLMGGRLLEKKEAVLAKVLAIAKRN